MTDSNLTWCRGMAHERLGDGVIPIFLGRLANVKSGPAFERRLDGIATYLFHTIFGKNISEVSREIGKHRPSVRHIFRSVEDLREIPEVDHILNEIEKEVSVAKGENMTNKPTWPNEQIEFMRQLYKAGMSSAHIAHGLNVEFGTAHTRNAVIGQLRRRGISYKGRDHEPEPQVKRAVPPRLQRVKQKPKPKQRVNTDDFLPKGVLPKSRECHWPEGDFKEKGDWQYCGTPIGQDETYCPEHHALGHQPTSRATKSEQAATRYREWT